MSNEDISMVCEVLLGITNPNKDIRTNSVNKLQELSKNLGALTYCLIEIASKPATNDKEKIVKTTALVIGRKIMDMQKKDNWKNIDNQLKENIKLNILKLLDTERDPGQNSKICDFINAIMEKVLDSEEEWPQLFSLVLSLYNFDPNDNSKIIQIRSLLKLLIGGTGYMYDHISKDFGKIIPYLEKLLDSGIDMKIKALAGEFISELLSFCDDKDIDLFKELVKKLIDNIYKCFLMGENMPEDCIKKLLEDTIRIQTFEETLFTPYFKEIFELGQKLIMKKDYVDEKIRELAFEFILNLVEEKPSIMKSKKKDKKFLTPFLEMAFSYALEFDKDVNQSWITPSGNNYDSNNIEDSTDEKVDFALSVIDRIIVCMGTEGCEKELKQILEQFLQKSWECQYFAFYVLGNYARYDQKMSKVENIFKILFNAALSPQPYLRFSAIHCINVFCDNYSPAFQTQNIKELIPLLVNLIKKETILRIQCEIISALISFIQFTKSEDLNPYVKELFELLFTLFKQNNIPIIIRKLVLEAILEIISTMEEEITPYAPLAFDIILDYFVQSYKNKENQILYGVLIECITSLGIYTREKYNKVIPDIVNCIVEIVKGFNIDKIEPIRADLTNSLDRLLDVLKDDFKNLLPNLIETVLALIKLRPKMSISSDPAEQFDINNLLKEDEDEDDKKKGKEIQTSETEELASSLSLLNTFITSIGSGFIAYFDRVESEILELITYKFDSKIRTKSSKVLPNLLNIITDQDAKFKKAREYIKLLLDAIDKELCYHVVEKYFVHLREIIENCGQFLNKNELNELFEKITKIFEILKEKREKLLLSKKLKLKKHNDDDDDDENIDDLIEEDIEDIESIQTEISDCIGIMFKTHKQISDEIVSIIITKIIPSYSSSKNNFEIKMGLYMTDDLIEYIGQDMLGDNNWNLMFQIVTQLVTSKDVSIRQAAAYGIGNFAKFTTQNFDNYAQKLIDSLYNAMNIENEKEKEGKDEEEEDEEYDAFGMAFDNMVAALGKIINFQLNNSKVVQGVINELINKWIMNLPIKYDDTEMEPQHEWLVDLFLLKRELIGENCYNHYFETLADIYEAKKTPDKINEKIKKIFNEYVKNDDKLKQIVSKIYENTDDTLKKKLEKLIK